MAPRLVFTFAVGQKINSWTVVGPRVLHNGRPHYLVECECGRRVLRQTTALGNGNSKSCGCRGGNRCSGCHEPGHNIANCKQFPDRDRLLVRCDRCRAPLFLRERATHVCEVLPGAAWYAMHRRDATVTVTTPLVGR